MPLKIWEFKRTVMVASSELIRNKCKVFIANSIDPLVNSSVFICFGMVWFVCLFVSFGLLLCKYIFIFFFLSKLIRISWV